MPNQYQTKPLDPLQEKWFDFVREEYVSLRAEVSDSLKNQQSIINYGLASIGVLIGFSANLWGKERFIEGIYIFFIPFICNLIILIWNGEVRRMSRAGQYIKSIEDKVHDELKQSPFIINRSLNWETYLRQPKQASQKQNMKMKMKNLLLFLFQKNKNNKINSNYIAIILMFAMLSVFSIALGVIHSYSAGDYPSIITWLHHNYRLSITYLSILVINVLAFTYHYRYFQKAKK
jgi:hypothetical protein